jgi:hypothetical protein
MCSEHVDCFKVVQERVRKLALVELEQQYQ